MKLPAFFTLLLASHGFAAEVSTPVPLPATRYEKMAEKSPFALATKVEAAAAAQPGFAANWTVAGLGRFGDLEFVTIKARDQSTQFSLYGHEPNKENGDVSLSSINWSDTLGKSTVIIQKGTETAKLEFNEADWKGAAGPAIQNPMPSPNAPTDPQRGGRREGIRAIPPPGTAPRPIIPRPGLPIPPPLPAVNVPQATNPTTGNEGRRRTRTIVAPPVQ